MTPNEPKMASLLNRDYYYYRNDYFNETKNKTHRIRGGTVAKWVTRLPHSKNVRIKIEKTFSHVGFNSSHSSQSV